MIRQRLGNALESLLDTRQLRRAPGLPTQVHMSVIDRCFLPCKHCDIWKNTDADLPTSFWNQAIDRLGEWCAPAGMNFVGGEPLMRTDLEDLIRRAKGWGFQTSFNTNAWLVTPQRAKSIADSGVDLVYVSLDGFSAQTVDHSRGKVGSFEKALTAVDLLQSQGVQVAIASVLHSQNQHEVQQLVRWVGDMGMNIIFQPLYQNFGNVEYDPDWWKTSEFFPKTTHEQKLMSDCLDWLSNQSMKGGVVMNSPMQLQAMKFYFTEPSKDAGVSCRAGHSDISIDPQGTIRLCYFLETVGSFHSAVPLAEQWNHHVTMRRRWEVSRCTRSCSLLNCNFNTGESA